MIAQIPFQFTELKPVYAVTFVTHIVDLIDIRRCCVGREVPLMKSKSIRLWEKNLVTEKGYNIVRQNVHNHDNFVSSLQWKLV